MEHQAPANTALTSSRSRSVARRVTALAIGMLAVVLLLLSLAVSYISTHTAREQLAASVTHATGVFAEFVHHGEVVVQRMAAVRECSGGGV